MTDAKTSEFIVNFSARSKSSEQLQLSSSSEMNEDPKTMFEFLLNHLHTSLVGTQERVNCITVALMGSVAIKNLDPLITLLKWKPSIDLQVRSQVQIPLFIAFERKKKKKKRGK